MSTPSWAKRYVPSSVALEHFALEAFSSPFSSPLSSAYPAPLARTPAPTTSSTSTTPAAHIPLRFIRVVLLSGMNLSSQLLKCHYTSFSPSLSTLARTLARRVRSLTQLGAWSNLMLQRQLDNLESC